MSSTVGDLIHEIDDLGLLWRVSSPGAVGAGTRAEAMVRAPGRHWIFGYGLTAGEALKDVLAKWKASV